MKPREINPSFGQSLLWMYLMSLGSVTMIPRTTLRQCLCKKRQTPDSDLKDSGGRSSINLGAWCTTSIKVVAEACNRSSCCLGPFSLRSSSSKRVSKSATTFDSWYDLSVLTAFYAVKAVQSRLQCFDLKPHLPPYCTIGGPM